MIVGVAEAGSENHDERFWMRCERLPHRSPGHDTENSIAINDPQIGRLTTTSTATTITVTAGIVQCKIRLRERRYNGFGQSESLPLPSMSGSEGRLTAI